MKKTLSILATVMVLCMTSCVNEPSHPIVGNAYGPDDDDEQMYFALSGKARLTYFDASMNYHSYDHYTYKIYDNVVNVYCDKSNFWKDSAKGSLFTSFVYVAERDVLLDENGYPWKRQKPRK